MKEEEVVQEVVRASLVSPPLVEPHFSPKSHATDTLRARAIAWAS